LPASKAITAFESGRTLPLTFDLLAFGNRRSHGLGVRPGHHAAQTLEPGSLRVFGFQRVEHACDSPKFFRGESAEPSEEVV
jgi:hypothetical protein